MLRLVRDDVVDFDDSLDKDFDDLEDMQEQEPADADQQADDPAAGPQASEELRDGAVEAADEAETSDSVELAPVNLGILEALLLSTHHPLTAGRLAELLDLPSTKPIRKAINKRMTGMSMAKCPKCETVVPHVKAEPILCEALPGKPSHEGISYLCPNCNTILGLEINPPSLQELTLGKE